MEYEIENIQDIVDAVTEENIENFLTDFELILRRRFGVQKIQDTLCENEGIAKTPIPLNRFLWVDDSEHFFDLTLRDDAGRAVKISSFPKIDA